MVVLAAAILAKAIRVFLFRVYLLGHCDHSILFTRLAQNLRSDNVSKKRHTRKYHSR